MDRPHRSYVENGQVHYYISGGGRGGAGMSGEIQNWVVANFTAVTVAGTTVYDLTGYTG
ncbi:MULTISPECIES: hypothetical protein [unclassified Rhodococcus (in: high G+C Gram-positive bacteria)]|uniref:hypothetical protein n=1 Tax=unclassified Rhodococcus (in: high G+C Gram-positive bacteria) TaxID=192944 RepID=UPI00163A141B|nr:MULTISPECIES: hypothetical protein [unclassified Rhodococcus (in: high G+C Gram-positive bacteria)]MBC2638965.1 hypothetical protein [Rhodococcus sp. 3A]MBC2896294.1 hypothetical protein [Rhodococcus sp. 4CII]